MEEVTNFDRLLEKELRDPEFREAFEAAERAWDVALQLAELRKARGLTQQQVAEKLGTKQQVIARLESAGYNLHSTRMIRRYASALGATTRVVIVPDERLAEFDAMVRLGAGAEPHERSKAIRPRRNTTPTRIRQEN
jgi:transcriptional regulator with XRE-family HTH domain